MPLTFFKPVDRGDVRMIQRSEGLGLALEPREAVGVMREGLGQDLDRDVDPAWCRGRGRSGPSPLRRSAR